MQERDRLVHFVRLAKTLLKDGESARLSDVMKHFVRNVSIYSLRCVCVHDATTTTTISRDLLSININSIRDEKSVFLHFPPSPGEGEGPRERAGGGARARAHRVMSR